MSYLRIGIKTPAQSYVDKGPHQGRPSLSAYIRRRDRRLALCGAGGLNVWFMLTNRGKSAHGPLWMRVRSIVGYLFIAIFAITL
jgi:hypothetical protein